tara:strand:- start:418 stop:615 length:198 start_codon:yes stop_codon:yes gene_type:complete
MKETAEERRLRLALQQYGYANATRILINERYGILGFKKSRRKDGVWAKPNVNLVKKYSKGSFKFV